MKINGNTVKTDKSAVKRTLNPVGIISLIVLFTYAVSLLFPLFWSIITSFRDPLSFLMDRYGGHGLWPVDWGASESWFNNYQTVLENFGMRVRNSDGTARIVGLTEQLGNSILYALGSTLCGTLTCLFIGYAVSLFDFRASKIIYVVIIVQMILPIVGSLPSEIKMATQLGLYDNMVGMWIMKTYVSGLHFLVFYSGFKLIPKDYIEAAQLDGAGNFSIMFRIMFPFLKGSIFTIALLKFIGFWNDYQTPLLYMPTHPTLAYGVYDFTRGSITGDTPTQLAATMLMAIPLFAIFIAFQKRLLGDLTIGGLK